MNHSETDINKFIEEYKNHLTLFSSDSDKKCAAFETTLHDSKEQLQKKKIENIQCLEEVRNLEVENSQQEKDLDILKRKIIREQEIILKKEKEREELHKQLKELETSIEKNEKILDELNRKGQAEAEKELKHLEILKRCLGIKMTRTNHNTLVFTFTQIQESDPEKKYIIEFRITEKDEYEIVQTVPPLKDLKIYEEKLNESNNFTGFLAFMRDLFSKIY